MTIKFKDTEYKIKEGLAVDKIATPLLISYRKLQAEYIDDIDTSKIKEYEARINLLETAIEQVKEKNESDLVEEGKTYGEYLSELETKLDAVKNDFENDNEVIITQKLIRDIEALLIKEVASDNKIMTSLYSKMLEGDVSKIDVNDKEYQKFSLEVLANFFILVGNNLKE